MWSFALAFCWFWDFLLENLKLKKKKNSENYVQSGEKCAGNLHLLKKSPVIFLGFLKMIRLLLILFYKVLCLK